MIHLDLESLLLGAFSGCILASGIVQIISKVGTKALQSELGQKLLPYVVKAFDVLDETLIDQLTLAGTVPANILLLAKQAVEEVSDGVLEPSEVESLARFIVDRFSIARFIEKVGSDD